MGAADAPDAAASAATGGPASALPLDEEDDLVDLSFAGPEPDVPSAPGWRRALDLAAAYVPIVLMALFAGLTWYLVRNAPQTEARRAPVVPEHVPDYTMSNFTVQRFDPTGRLRTQIEGTTLRHYPDDDTVEVDQARLRAIGSDGSVTWATARRALSNADGSEVQLFGDARVWRPAGGRGDEVDFRSEFMHGFSNLERVRSHLPVVVTQGTSVVRAEGMDYDHLARVADTRGRSTATFYPPAARRAASAASAARPAPARPS